MYNNIVFEVTKEWADAHALSLPSLYENGESFAEVCSVLGINKDQYKEACKCSENFSAADKYSQVVHEAWWMKAGREGVHGKRINGAVWNHTMNNRYGWSNNGGTDDGSKGRVLNLGVVFVGSLPNKSDMNGVLEGVVERMGIPQMRAENQGFEDI